MPGLKAGTTEQNRSGEVSNSFFSRAGRFLRHTGFSPCIALAGP